MRLYKNFHGSLCDLLASGPSNREKHLDIFFKSLSQRCLVACFGDLFATHSNHENREFCTIRVFFREGFKKFSFFLASYNYSYSCSSFPFSKSLCSHTKSPYSPSPLHQSLRTGMGFVSFSIYFTLLAIYLLDCVFRLISMYLILEYGYLIFW